MNKTSIYSDCQSLVRRGEGLFPFACFEGEVVDWVSVQDYLMGIGWDE